MRRAPGDERCAAAARSHAQVFAYQWVPLLALLSGRVRRLLLADAVGMGKTVQAALVLAELHARRAPARSLIVVPAGLVEQWRDELQARVGLAVHVLDGEALAARSTRAHEPVASPGEACLVSIDTLRQPEVLALMARATWQVLVVDEAHLLAPGTARATAVARVAAVATQMLLLTATPFTGEAHADRHLLALGRDPGLSDRLLVVRRKAPIARRRPVRLRVVRPVAGGAEDQAILSALDAYVSRAAAHADRGGTPDAAGHLAALLLRRRACSSRLALSRTLARRVRALSLPETETMPRQPSLPLAGDDPDDVDWLGVPAWDDVEAEVVWLKALAARVRRLDDPGSKLRWVARWLHRVREPVLVFTDYVDTLRALRSLLTPAWRVAGLHGALTPAQRRLVIEGFNAGDLDVLVATDAAAEGLNLHERCRLVVHVDVPWTPRRLAQRNGRLDRIGQTRQVCARILALRSEQDAETLTRLLTRGIAVDEASAELPRHLALHASTRRECLAHAVVDAHGLSQGGRGSEAAAMTPGTDALVTRVTAARGRRITACLTTRPAVGIELIELCAGGLHPMVRACRWFWFLRTQAARASGVDPADAADVYRRHGVVRRFERRASHRAGRWATLDARVASRLPPVPTADLFLGDETARVVTVDSGPPATEGHPALHIGRRRSVSWPR